MINKILKFLLSKRVLTIKKMKQCTLYTIHLFALAKRNEIKKMAHY